MAIVVTAISLAIVLPQANALTPRLDFNDNHFTYRTFGTIHICGDHLCDSKEWGQWVAQLMTNQIKNGGALPLERIPGTYAVNQTYANSGGSLIDTSSAKITKVTIFDMGNNEFSSFISISYNGYLNINHIVVSQTSPGTLIHRAWIEPQWSSTIKSGKVTFDSSESTLYHDRVINVVIVTDGMPSFSLDTLASSQFS